MAGVDARDRDLRASGVAVGLEASLADPGLYLHPEFIGQAPNQIAINSSAGHVSGCRVLLIASRPLAQFGETLSVKLASGAHITLVELRAKAPVKLTTAIVVVLGEFSLGLQHLMNECPAVDSYCAAVRRRGGEYIARDARLGDGRPRYGSASPTSECAAITS